MDYNTVLRNIVKVYDNSTKRDINISNIDIKLFVSPSSNTKEPVYRIFYDGNPIKKNNNYTCDYKCQSCDRITTVSLNNITRKLKNGITTCRTCKELVEEKRGKHSIFMKENANDIFNGTFIKQDNNLHPKPVLKDKLNKDQVDFHNMDENFKNEYFKKHLTCEEFDKIKDKIMSFQHEKFKNITKFEYYPCVSIHNQTKFNPYLYDTENDTIENITYIHYRCENCDEIFFNRDLYIQKNKFKILCKDCNFTNNIFKIRTCTNLDDEKIKFQSKLEKKLIDFCNNNKIVIQNGPYLKYKFNDKEKIYRVDFQIPSLGILIECKDEHIWHIKNVQSGQWDAKVESVNNFITSQDKYKTFIMIFPKCFNEKTQYLANLSRYSLNLYESTRS
jgi:formylmethanofuran dehydrogenase subunit E